MEHKIEEHSRHFVFSPALIEAMRKLSDHYRVPCAPVQKQDESLARMQRLIERCRARC